MHNYGWFLCQQQRYAEVERACSRRRSPCRSTAAPPRTLLAQGVCQARAGQLGRGRASLARAYELDPSSPFTATNLSEVLYRRGEFERARFYMRRVNAHARRRQRADAVAGGAHREQARQPARARPSSARSCATASPSRARRRPSRAGAFDE